MTDTQIRFDDGAAYERMMGIWSGLAGAVFIDWLKPPAGWRWIDIGCGNGAFSEQLVERCAPAAVRGIDPSQGQIDFARSRPAARLATFEIGNADEIGAGAGALSAGAKRKVGLPGGWRDRRFSNVPRGTGGDAIAHRRAALQAVALVGPERATCQFSGAAAHRPALCGVRADQ